MLAIVDGFPAGVTIETDSIDVELQRRQGGYGRGGRQRIETDKVEVLTGVWHNQTLGSPVALQVVNRDYKLERLDDLQRPRPGHGDLTGAIKFLGPIRGILERASARETSVRVAAGGLAKQLRRRPAATRSAASWKSASKASRSAWERTRNGIANWMAVSLRP